MSRKSSKQWLKRQRKDHYVQKAKTLNYRSRASFKLLELNKKDAFLQPHSTIVDLGAAPGGWSQVAAEQTKNTSKIIALDILPMQPLTGVEFIQGDFTSSECQLELQKTVTNNPIKLVISDLAPNISGIKAIDQARSMLLAELALDFAIKNLVPGGAFVCKVFQGEGCDAFLKLVKSHFQSVKNRKPEASRTQSREFYLVASGFFFTAN